MRAAEAVKAKSAFFDLENRDEEQNQIDIRRKRSGVVGAGDLHVSINGPTAEPDA